MFLVCAKLLQQLPKCMQFYFKFRYIQYNYVFSLLLIQLKNVSFPPNSSFYFQEFTSVRFQPLLSEVISSISRLQVSPISLVIAFLFAIHICLDISQGFPSLEK